MAGGGRRFLKASGTESLPYVWANPGVLRSKSWVEYVPPGEKGEDKSLQLWRRKRGETVMSDQVWIAQVFSSDAEHREWVCWATRRTWRVPGGHRGGWSPHPHSPKPFHGEEALKFTYACGVHRKQLRITSVWERAWERAEDRSQKGGPSTRGLRGAPQDHWVIRRPSASGHRLVTGRMHRKQGFTVLPGMRGRQGSSTTPISHPPPRV